MEHMFIKYIYESFEKLVDEYGFHKANEVNDGQSYSIEYRSNSIAIKLEKYRREFYVTLYKISSPDKEINLFNLLSYLKQDASSAPVSRYFQEESDLNECYRKQISYLSTIIYDNFFEINDFFNQGDYELKVTDVRAFILNKYPELFKRINKL